MYYTIDHFYFIAIQLHVKYHLSKFLHIFDNDKMNTFMPDWVLSFCLYSCLFSPTPPHTHIDTHTVVMLMKTMIEKAMRSFFLGIFTLNSIGFLLRTAMIMILVLFATEAFV